MPYIPKENREHYDELIESLAKHLAEVRLRGGNSAIAGELNYIIYRLTYILCHHSPGTSIGYAGIATILSAMNEAQSELRRRVLVPYEDNKILQNGDVSI